MKRAKDTFIERAKHTSYHENVTFTENDAIYRIYDKQLITKNNKNYYMYSVCKQEKYSNNSMSYGRILVDARIAQKRTCEAIYNEIKACEEREEREECA